MNRKVHSSGLALLAVTLLLVGCGTAAQSQHPGEPVPTASPVPPTPEPTASPTAVLAKAGEQWDYVAIGGADTWGFDKNYAAYIEEDLGAEVTVDDWHVGRQTSVSLLAKLQSNQALQEAVGKAEVVTFTAQPADRIGWQCMNEDMADLDCSPEALAAFEADYDAIISEILSLRSGSETIIHTMDLYMPFYSLWQDQGIYDECWRCWEAVNESIHRAAAEHGIPVAPVYDAFNGPAHDEDPGDKGYVETAGADVGMMGGLTRAGRAAVAVLLRELGYERVGP